ncbi:MAG: non-homologous end-joining DNA ligase [Deltaproteobacteria bacterium]
MALKDYTSKRTFAKTPEPKAELHPATDRLVFVVQKHAARALHYDLRLELDGVLKSWAVPRGPSLDPSRKRLAVRVEDHPFDYKDFEGVIPEGNYGAGSVIIWDRGFYHHIADPDGSQSEKLLREGLKKGHLTFILHGEKLRGEFALVKTKQDEKSWLLLKKNDRFASTNDILTENRSVVSRENLEEVARANSGRPPRPEQIDRIHLREAMEGADLKDAPVKPMPHHIRPMLATLTKEPFDHPDWIFEMKWDGYRAIAEVSDGQVDLYSRNGISFAGKYPPVLDALKRLRLEAVLDGEIVVVDPDGHPDFQMLQDYPKNGKGYLLYYVFDLLYFQGHDLTGLPLSARKALLKKILPSSPVIKLSDHIEQDGVSFFKVVEKAGLEGIVAKQAEGIYRPGKRSAQWLKIKTHLTQEAVIAGFTEPRGTRNDFGALVLGVFEKNELVFIGHTGGGFNAQKLKNIRAKLNPLIRRKCPFKTEPRTNTPVTWVKPTLVCEVVFRGWTGEGLMRQPVFSRLREDKAARDVARETLDDASSPREAKSR